jgi:hypothetical protein
MKLGFQLLLWIYLTNKKIGSAAHLLYCASRFYYFPLKLMTLPSLGGFLRAADITRPLDIYNQKFYTHAIKRGERVNTHLSATAARRNGRSVMLYYKKSRLPIGHRSGYFFFVTISMTMTVRVMSATTKLIAVNTTNNNVNVSIIGYHLLSKDPPVALSALHL